MRSFRGSVRSTEIRASPRNGWRCFYRTYGRHGDGGVCPHGCQAKFELPICSVPYLILSFVHLATDATLLLVFPYVLPFKGLNARRAASRCAILVALSGILFLNDPHLCLWNGNVTWRFRIVAPVNVDVGVDVWVMMDCNVASDKWGNGMRRWCGRRSELMRMRRFSVRSFGSICADSPAFACVLDRISDVASTTAVVTPSCDGGRTLPSM